MGDFYQGSVSNIRDNPHTMGWKYFTRFHTDQHGWKGFARMERSNFSYIPELRLNKEFHNHAILNMGHILHRR